MKKDCYTEFCGIPSQKTSQVFLFTLGLSVNGMITRAVISSAMHYGNYYVCGLYQSPMSNDSGTHAIDAGFTVKTN